MSSSDIANGIIAIIKTPINLVNDIWDTLLTPIFIIDLGFLNSPPFSWLYIDTGFEFGTYDINLLFFMSGLGVLVFIVLKVITLINPFG